MHPITFKVVDLDDRRLEEICCYIEQLPMMMEEYFPGIPYTVEYERGYEGLVKLDFSYEEALQRAEEAEETQEDSIPLNIDVDVDVEWHAEMLKLNDREYKISTIKGPKIFRKQNLLLQRCVPTQTNWVAPPLNKQPPRGARVLSDELRRRMLTRGLRIARLRVQSQTEFGDPIFDYDEYGIYDPRKNNIYLTHVLRAEMIPLLVSLIFQDGETRLRAAKEPLNLGSRDFVRLVDQIRQIRIRQGTRNVPTLDQLVPTIHQAQAQLNELTQEEAALKEALASLDEVAPIDLEALLEEIRELPQAANVSAHQYLDHRGLTIKIITNELAIEHNGWRFPLGSFDVSLSLSGIIHVAPHHGNIIIGERCHPLVIRNMLVLGRLAEVVPRLVEQKRYKNLAQVVLRLLESVPEEERLLEQFPPIEIVSKPEENKESEAEEEVSEEVEDATTS